MSRSKTSHGFALLIVAAVLALPTVAKAEPQWSGIKGRAWIENFLLSPSLTNVLGISTVSNLLASSSGFVATRIPIKTVIQVYAAKSGRFVRTVETDDSGRFAVRLQPGLYRLEPATIWDGRILKPGDVITMDMNHIVQTAPVQVVRIGGLRYASINVVYHTIWPRLRQIPSRPLRDVPLPGPPVAIPPTVSSSHTSIEQRPNLPPLPPTPLTPPDSPNSPRSGVLPVSPFSQR